jgi:hypothetical protein
MVVAVSAEGEVEQGSWDVSGGKSLGNEIDCNDIQPAASPCYHWSTQSRVPKPRGKQAEKVSVEKSGGRTGGCRT